MTQDDIGRYTQEEKEVTEGEKDCAREEAGIML
jgi:hypothetical protein